MTSPPKGVWLSADSRREVEAVLARYCWAVDERDRDAVASCFTAMASWSGTVAGGSARIGPHVGADAVADWLASLWAALASQRRHAFIGLIGTSTHDGNVQGRASFILLGGYAVDSCLEVTGVYDFILVRERGEWRVARMVATFDSLPQSIP